MKCIGIIGAMEQEVAKIKEKMQDVTITSRARMDFYEGTLEGKKVVVVRSGIGKVNAGMCTQILADVFGVEAVINTGIAGSLNNDVNIGDIVLSTDVLHHDMDAIGFGYKKGQIPQMDEFSFPADEKLRKLAAKVCKEVNPEISVFEGRICSGDQFISDKSVKDAIISEFGGFAVEMEGEWGFDGVVVSDWGGVHDTDQAIKNGLDMEFGSWTDGLANTNQCPRLLAYLRGGNYDCL